MRNFHLEFAYPWTPWLFLLLIPALLATLIPYFMMDKRYRKTRNRIVSMVLHMIIMTLAITILTGVTFAYEEGNPDNELLLLVDLSDTEENEAEQRDELVEQIVADSAYDGFKVGIVTFGFTQEYAVPLTHDLDGVYDAYLNAPRPDTSATDIAAALRYARGLFENPETSKIVLITDGKETDEQALNVIGSLASQKTRVDVVNVASLFGGDNVQVTDVQFPDYHLSVGDVCEIGVTVQSRLGTEQSTIEFSDNGEKNDALTQQVALSPGTQQIVFKTSFQSEGLHEIRIKVTESDDNLAANNEYCTYYYLERFKKVCIIEQQEGQSEKLSSFLKQEENGYEVDVLNLTTAETLPTSVDELCKYDQIILNNISNRDMLDLPIPKALSDSGETRQDWFIRLIYDYVNKEGGGLFTVGGSDEQGNAHAYNRVDMNGDVNFRLYQEMLPVQAIDYTPPLAVIVIIDVSGSMGGSGENTPLYWAKQGAIYCLDALSDRDYIGVMTLDSNYGDVLPLTRRTQEKVIRETINAIDGVGGTVYSDAIARAGQKLLSQPGVDRRHIVVISDGAPSADDEEYYMKETRDNFRNGVTLSFIGIGIAENSTQGEKMKELTDAGGGEPFFVDTNDLASLLNYISDDLNADEVKEYEAKSFYPQVADVLSPLVNGVEFGDEEDEEGNIVSRALGAKLGGFYGVRARANVDLVLTGDNNVPLYAQWQFGKGKVGSFMSDLNGTWSSEFLADESCQKFLINAISNLMPTQNIRPSEFAVSITGDNYIRRLNLSASLGEGETVRAEIIKTATGETVSLNEVTEQPQERNVYVTEALTGEAGNLFTRCTFVVKESGCYRIHIAKYNAEGEEIASYETYDSFAYSLEYDQNMESADLRTNLGILADRGSGQLIETPEDIWLIFENFVTAFSREFDPRWLFMGLAIALFLLDIAARKFKFKWIHEIVRERRARRAEEHQGRGGK